MQPKKVGFKDNGRPNTVVFKDGSKDLQRLVWRWQRMSHQEALRKDYVPLYKFNSFMKTSSTILIIINQKIFGRLKETRKPTGRFHYLKKLAPPTISFCCIKARWRIILHVEKWSPIIDQALLITRQLLSKAKTSNIL
ncbi:hypothetical protein R6Q59_027760 [Mikania micrantha]